MPSLSDLRKKTAANPNSVFNGGSNLAPAPITPENLVQIPAAAPLDLPVPMPQRGVFPPNLVMVSDRSDSTRVFRGPNTRSAVFQTPAQPNAAAVAAAVSTTASVAAAVEILVNNQPTASQKIINFINSATVQWQSGANGQISATAPAAGGDGLTHLEPTITPGSWESDPAYIILRDEFTGFHANGAVPVSPYIGQLGWGAVNSSGALHNIGYYTAGNTGVIQIGSSAGTAGQGYSILLDGSDSVATAATQGFPLTYVGGWQAEFIFRYPKFAANNLANPASKLRLYIGFASAPTANSGSVTFTPRPAGFIGLRYDTDPNIWTLSAAATASGGSTTYTGLFTGATANALVGQSFTVAGFVAHVSNNGTFTCTANSTTTITLNNASGVAETQAATATGTAFSDTSYQFEAVQNGPIGSNIQGTVISSGITIDNNWHRFRMRSLVAGTILFSIDGGTESAISVSTQTITASSANGHSISLTQLLHSGGLQTHGLTQTIVTGGSPAAGTPVVVAGVTGSPQSGLNGTWNAAEQQNNLSTAGNGLIIDTSSISSNAGGTSSTGTVTFYNTFAPFIMMMNDSTGSNTQKNVQVDFFSFVWNPGLSAAGGTPVATHPRGW